MKCPGCGCELVGIIKYPTGPFPITGNVTVTPYMVYYCPLAGTTGGQPGCIKAPPIN